MISLQYLYVYNILNFSLYTLVHWRNLLSNEVDNARFTPKEHLVEDYSLKVALRLANGEDINKIYFDEYNFDFAYNVLSQSSLFSSTNILLIIINKKIVKKDVDKLINACELNNDSKVIFSCLGEIDFRVMSKSFTHKTNSCQVRFFTPYDNEAIAILNEKSLTLGVKTDSNTLMYLIIFLN